MLISVLDMVKYSRCWVTECIKHTLDIMLGMWYWEKENVKEGNNNKTHKKSKLQKFHKYFHFLIRYQGSKWYKF